MIYISKMGISDELQEEIIKLQKNSEWISILESDTNAIRSFFDDEFPKEKMKRALIAEQHGLCAYCMRRIRDDSHTTLEHLIPISKNKDGALDYRNIFGVCDGGREKDLSNGRILSCDACKAERTLHISPLNKDQMNKISYNKDGYIYTDPKDDEMEKDLNEILGLNGKRTTTGKTIDSATELIKSRRDAYTEIRDAIRRLDRRKQCTSKNIEKLLQSYKNKQVWGEFIGVKLYYMKKKIISLRKQGL